MKTASEALELLRQGNQRFLNNSPDRTVLTNQTPSKIFIEHQRPHTIILGCSDSRVPVEMVFDQSAGDLFVVRVAGNVIAPSQAGSVEFAASEFGTRLVVVLGHTMCGAISATIRSIRNPENEHSSNVMSIVNRIRPNICGLVEDDSGGDDAQLAHRAMRENVRASVDQLRNGSEVLETLINSDGLEVVGAEYNVKTGVVEFIE